MKTWKHGIIGILAIIALTFAFIACGNDNGGDNPVLCTCNPKAHLGIDETCTCGGEDCTACTLQIYGTVGGVNIYRKGAVENMAEAVSKVQEACEQFGDMSNKIGKIIIIPGNNSVRNRYAENGKWTVEIGADATMLNTGTYFSSTLDTPVPTI